MKNNSPFTLIALLFLIFVIKNSSAKTILPVVPIPVVGTVVDSVTSSPIENALVLLFDVNDTSQNPVPDTAYTDSDGKISGTVNCFVSWIGDTILPNVTYTAYKDKYNEKSGTGEIDTSGGIMNAKINLGTIELAPEIISIKYFQTPIQKNAANSIAIYSLKGQLLYTGKEIDLRIFRSKGITRFQPLIICYKLNKIVVAREKITFTW